MGKNYTIGTKLVDNRFGLHWVVRELIPDGFKVQQDQPGGVFIDVTPETCSMQFSPVKECGA